jgi:hypothetical protein
MSPMDKKNISYLYRFKKSGNLGTRIDPGIFGFRHANKSDRDYSVVYMVLLALQDAGPGKTSQAVTAKELQDVLRAANYFFRPNELTTALSRLKSMGAVSSRSINVRGYIITEWSLSRRFKSIVREEAKRRGKEAIMLAKRRESEARDNLRTARIERLALEKRFGL